MDRAAIGDAMAAWRADPAGVAAGERRDTAERLGRRRRAIDQWDLVLRGARKIRCASDLRPNEAGRMADLGVSAYRPSLEAVRRVAAPQVSNRSDFQSF